MCKSENCQLPNEDTSEYCILHCEKKHQDIQRFNIAFEKFLEENKDEKSLKLNDIIFPNNFDYNKIFESFLIIEFWNCEFNSLDNNLEFDNVSKCHYYECKFNKQWVHLNIENICYSNCHFNGNLYLFDQDDVAKTEKVFNLNFNDCVFENEFNLDFSASNLSRCKVNTIDIQNSTFKKAIKINKCDIENYFLFSLNSVLGIVEFEDNNFKEIDFIRNKFNKVVSFYKTIFDRFGFVGNYFDELVIFENTIFQQKLNLENNIFKDEVNFINIKNKDSKELKSENIANRETARIIKHSFEKLDNIIEANKFYALEMEKQEKELKWREHFAEKLIFKFHQISSNHSQDWLLVLLWMLNITVLYTHFSFLMIDEKTEYYIIPFILNSLTTVMIGFYFTKICKVLWTLVSCLIYVFIACDYLLCFIANDFNPFSIMTGQESLTFGTLIYKSIIAYLIYQFIVSIRQNTRRQ